ncbi:peptidase inhibitor family I36 protein [Streptoalloteichus hindustanus]|uniref:Peptidase inhibitor family I36 n=1 Tax=Streptoalloteichus hindustanus TaxID=2017 RepID=A0A1M5DLI1_STRHI|nr:peptidase inhibitor family I36 protein [Streptoalloteichus hindustanus]SHF67622.1 Peptidase inhibitor family I36 [Streptoalloteichus hindustanus]
MFITKALAAAAVLAAASLTVPAHAAASPDVSPRAFNCAAGYFCIYSDYDGGGTRCQWRQKKVANTADDCSFIRRGKKVRSVWNNTNHRVQYYTSTNYNNRVGSTPSLAGGNLQGSYQIRSFQPQ